MPRMTSQNSPISLQQDAQKHCSRCSASAGSHPSATYYSARITGSLVRHARFCSCMCRSLLAFSTTASTRENLSSSAAPPMLSQHVKSIHELPTRPPPHEKKKTGLIRVLL